MTLFSDAVEIFWSVRLFCVVWISVQCKCRFWIWVTIKIRCKLAIKNIRFGQQIGIRHQDLQGKCSLYRLDIALLSLCVHMCVCSLRLQAFNQSVTPHPLSIIRNLFLCCCVFPTRHYQKLDILKLNRFRCGCIFPDFSSE